MAKKKDKKAENQAILDYFAELPDPRRDNENKRHELIDIIAIAILATICGAEHFTEMEEWDEANADWLRTFLELPNGIPSHDTFGNVFAKLDTADFKKWFISWVDAIRTVTDGDLIAIDGKTLRRSHNRRVGQGAIHLALVRKLTHNLLQQETTLKRGIQTKRLKAGWDRSYLLKILNVKPSNS